MFCGHGLEAVVDVGSDGWCVWLLRWLGVGHWSEKVVLGLVLSRNEVGVYGNVFE